MLPLLIPAGIVMILVRFSLASRDSRKRIKLLEQSSAAAAAEDGEGGRFLHMLREIDNEMGSVLAELVDEPGTASAADAKGATTLEELDKEQPILTRDQKAMAGALNAIPQLNKHLVYIPDVINSHAVIVSRDVVNFPLHKLGEGVIRHFADHMDL